jgi:mono/diheme cytochrome c family protein
MFRTLCLFAALVVGSMCATSVSTHAQDASTPEANIRQPTAADPRKSDNNALPVSKITHKPPLEVVESAKIGTIHNPYTGNADMIAEGKKVFFGKSCNGCHGGGGGGGMCPSLKNVVWVYGSDDDTLFRLIALGSQGLQAKGYVRKGQENVVGPMPPFGGLIKDDDEEFKLIAFLHSLYDGPKSRVNW